MATNMITKKEAINASLWNIMLLLNILVKKLNTNLIKSLYNLFTKNKRMLNLILELECNDQESL